MPATIMWAHGFEKSPYSLKFVAPDGSNWKPATQLDPQDDGSFTAPFLDRLMDGTTEISVHDWNEWKLGAATFRVSLHHRGAKEEADAYAKMCEATVIEAEGVSAHFPSTTTARTPSCSITCRM
jgi:predicted metalloprotease with PDZ domain